jgi:FkbM family methyltransferase
MSIPSFVQGDRGTLEETARRAAQTVTLGAGTLMCRVLGKYLMFVDPHDLGVTPRLCLDGFWESWITTALVRVVVPGACVVDVGANHGYYTMLLADGVGRHGRVLAIEPNPALAALLALSVEVNGFDGRVVVAQQAASDGAARTARLAVPHRRGACATICRDPSPGDAAIDVTASCVDDLTASWPRVDLVKIDAEGAEPLVWAGMQRTVRDNPGLIVVLEFVASRYRDAAGFLSGIVDAGFDLRYVAPDSAIEGITAHDLLGDGPDGEGWTLFLERAR